jgi:hypothetical protein
MVQVPYPGWPRSRVGESWSNREYLNCRYRRFVAAERSAVLTLCLEWER